jgi:plastocyanin
MTETTTETTNEHRARKSVYARIPFWVYVALVPLLGCIAVIVTGTGSDGGGTSATPSAGTGDALTISNFTFGPDPIVVPIGTTVTVTNRDDTAHTLTAKDGSFDTGEIGGGQTATITLDRAGTYAYFCDIHQYMKGTVRVSGSPDERNGA